MKRKKRHIIWSLSSVEFKDLVLKSSSFGKILKYFNIKNVGSHNKTIKQRCIEENIDISHIKLGIKSNLGRRFAKEDSIDKLKKLLTINSIVNNANLKKRLLKFGLLENKCKLCGNDGTWLGKPITLHLHHINGIHTDNRIENLKIVCPNCHQQTENWGFKTSKTIKINNCLSCGSKCNSPNSKYCKSCYNEKRKIISTNRKGSPLKLDISKEILEKYVNSMPITKIATIFNVSDNCIKKKCIKFGIKLKGRGYWLKNNYNAI